METKVCTGKGSCGVEKSIEDFPTRKLKNGKIGTRSLCKLCMAEYKSTIRKNNPEVYRKYSNDWRYLNPERIRQHKKKYNDSHRDKNRTYARSNQKRTNKRLKFRRDNDLEYKLKISLRSRLYNAVKRRSKKGSAVRDLGCSISHLVIWLEQQFYRHPSTGEFMTWDNYGVGWHIDHVIPLARFDLSDREQIVYACNYTNLQPLWAEENLSKGNRFEG